MLDHRAEAFIPELGRTFACAPGFRVFAAQNPLQEGGGRRGLPRSFLNRFTRVHVELLQPADLELIAGARPPPAPPALASSLGPWACRDACQNRRGCAPPERTCLLAYTHPASSCAVCIAFRSACQNKYAGPHGSPGESAAGVPRRRAAPARAGRRARAHGRIPGRAARRGRRRRPCPARRRGGRRRRRRRRRRAGAAAERRGRALGVQPARPAALVRAGGGRRGRRGRRVRPCRPQHPHALPCSMQLPARLQRWTLSLGAPHACWPCSTCRDCHGRDRERGPNMCCAGTGAARPRRWRRPRCTTRACSSCSACARPATAPRCARCSPPAGARHWRSRRGRRWRCRRGC